MESQHKAAHRQSFSATSVHGTLVPTPRGDITATDLTPKQEAFAQAYVECGSVVDAYRLAYDVGPHTAATTARNNGHKILAHPKVATGVRALRAVLCEGALMTTTELVADLEAMVDADPNELVSVSVVNCRHCYGEGHGYQWRDESELARAVSYYMAALGSPKPLPAPDITGGFGFRPDRAPHEHCPRCDGVGKSVVRLNDTNEVSPGARRLLRGIELFPDGSVKRILLHDQFAARQELHKLKGMHVERSITAHVTVPTLKDMSRDEMLDFLESLKPAT